MVRPVEPVVRDASPPPASPTAPKKTRSPDMLAVTAGPPLTAPRTVALKRPVGPVMRSGPLPSTTGSLNRKELVINGGQLGVTVVPAASVSRVPRPLMAPLKLVTPPVLTVREPAPVSVSLKLTLPPALTRNAPLMLSGLMKVALPFGVTVTAPPPEATPASWILDPAVTAMLPPAVVRLPFALAVTLPTLDVRVRLPPALTAALMSRSPPVDARLTDEPLLIAELTVRVPGAVRLKAPEADTPARLTRLTLVRVMLAPTRFTVPKLLPGAFNVMLKPCALRKVEPGTTEAPLSVMAPPALIVMVPAALMPGRLMGALSKIRVKSRRLVRPAKFVVAGKMTGTLAPTFTFRRPRSRILDTVPASTGAMLPRSLACVLRRMSDSGDVREIVVCPLILSGPLSVIDPAVVTFRT